MFFNFNNWFSKKITLTKKVGNLGEKMAADYLTQKGYVLVERNYTKPWGEIDLIMKKGRLIQFIEVKTMTKEGNASRGVDYYEPSDRLTQQKKDRLYKTIHSYIQERGFGDYDWQLGACLVYLDKKNLSFLEIEFIEEI